MPGCTTSCLHSLLFRERCSPPVCLHCLVSHSCLAAPTDTLLFKIRNHKLYDRYFYYDPEVRA